MVEAAAPWVVEDVMATIRMWVFINASAQARQPILLQISRGEVLRGGDS
jgi:hypothetical protein